MVVYSWPRVQYEENIQKIDFLNFLGILISIQGVQGTIREGSEPISEVKNVQNCNFLFFVIFEVGIPHCGIFIFKILIFTRAFFSMICAKCFAKIKICTVLEADIAPRILLFWVTW